MNRWATGTVARRPALRRPISKFQRGFAATLIFDIGARGVGALTTVILIRFLAVGAYAFVIVFLAVGQFVGSAATGGLRVLYVRTEAERVARGSVHALPFGAVLVGTLVIIAAFAVAGAAIAELADVGPAHLRLPFVALCALLSAGQGTVDLVTYHHQAGLRFRRGGQVQVTRNVALLVAAVLVSALLSASKIAVAAALTGASLAAAAFAAGNVLVHDPEQRKLRGTRLGFSAESGWLTIYSFVAAGFATVDIFIVAIILTANDVASFGAAQRYYAIALGVVPALEAVLRVRTSQPDIVESSEAQASALTAWIKRSALLTGIAVLLLALASPTLHHVGESRAIPKLDTRLPDPSRGCVRLLPGDARSQSADGPTPIQASRSQLRNRIRRQWRGRLCHRSCRGHRRNSGDRNHGSDCLERLRHAQRNAAR